MKRSMLLLIACALLMVACATADSGPPTVIYPDAEQHPQDYNPGQR